MAVNLASSDPTGPVGGPYPPCPQCATGAEEPPPCWLLHELPDLICRYQPDGTLLYVNRAYAEYFGSTPEVLAGRNFLDLIPPGLRTPVEDDVRAVLDLRPDSPVAVNEHRSTDGSGRVRWLQWTDKALFGADGVVRQILAVGRDVTERREAEEQAQYLAGHDPLTRLLNRRTLRQELEHALAEARRTGTTVGVVYLDVDGLKAINDRLGHAAGDRLLVSIGHRIEHGFRPWDRTARVGGDEFVVLCTRITAPGEMDELAQRARSLAGGSMEGVAWTVSVGVATSDGHHDPDELLDLADGEMYRRRRTDRA
jgi:diguanylate cyclase (GGDEF)-like protein/PAS domain S-box-containing protein